MIKAAKKKKSIFSKWLKFNKPSKNKDGFFTMPGLFSYKKVDPASQFLTSTFNNQISGDVIDLGAGWGFLSSRLLKNCFKVKSITLVDNDKRAITCAKMNITSSKARFECIDVNETSRLGLKFDSVVTNPPFHSNKGINIDLAKNFIKVASQNLKNSGNLLLVANIHLPYENLVKALFNNFQIYSQNDCFKIILAKEPKRYYDSDAFRI